MSEYVASPTPPDLRALLDNFKSEVMQATNAHKVGIIESFNPTLQTASVRIATLAQTNQGQIPYPLLTDCPVYFPAGGGAYMTFPIAVGDPCLVLFNDQDIDNWFTTGNVVVPNTERTHSLSDGMVLVGWRTKANPTPVFDTGTIALWHGASRITIDDSGNIVLQGPGGSAGYVKVQSKVNIAAGANTLKAAMDQLCDTLTAWVNTGGSTPNTATLTAISNLKTAFGQILTSS